MSTHQRIDGTAIAATIAAKVDHGVAALKELGHAPHLVAVQVGDDPATHVYVEKQKERFAKRGIQYTHLALDESTTESVLLTHIQALNDNPTVTGIILTLPLPPSISPVSIQERIQPEKDVEAVNPANLGRLVYSRHSIGPCTAMAVLEAVRSTGEEIRGKNVVVVGHSDIVGKPAGLLLLQELGTVTTCHVETRDLKKHTSAADILVVAVGKAGLIRADMVREGAIVIDVGINRDKDGKLVGDVAFDEVAPKCSWITPVPGGVGPITVAILAQNTLICGQQMMGEHQRRHSD